MLAVTCQVPRKKIWLFSNHLGSQKVQNGTLDAHMFHCFDSIFVENKPQMLLLSATMPKWVQDASKKYMSKDKKIVDLVGDTASKAATTVEVSKLILQHSCGN